MASVKVKGVERLLERFNNIANADLTEAMGKATALVHGQAKTLAPVDTGNLRGTIHFEVNKKSNTVEGRVYTNCNYASYVEFGTGDNGRGTYPYDIDGLSLQYHNGGWIYYSDELEQFVYTHGQKAQPYMYPALKQMTPKVKEILNAGVHTQIKSQCKGG